VELAVLGRIGAVMVVAAACAPRPQRMIPMNKMALGGLKAVEVVAVADLLVIRTSFMTEIASYVLAGLEPQQEKRLRVSLEIYDISRYGRTI